MPRLTNQSLILRIQAALGDSPSAEIDVKDIINEAGQHLYSMRQWTFRERPPADLAFIEDQPWVRLPADFGELVAFALDGTSSDFQFQTPQVIADLRSESVSLSSHRYWGSIVYPGVMTQGGDFEGPRIELYPTPGDENSVLRVWYLADWPDIQLNDDPAPIPPYAVTLLTEIARAIAFGYEEPEEGGVADRLSRIELSPFFQVVLRRDSMTQSDYGHLEGRVGGDWLDNQTFPTDSSWVT